MGRFLLISISASFRDKKREGGGARLEAPEDFSRVSDRVLVSFKGTEFELRSTSRPFKVAIGVVRSLGGKSRSWFAAI